KQTTAHAARNKGEQQTIVPSVAEPARGCSANKAEHASCREEPRSGDLCEAVIDASRDQVRADQPVDRGPANKVAAGDQPKIARSRPRSQCPKGDGHRVAVRRWRAGKGAIGTGTVGRQAEILRTV